MKTFVLNVEGMTCDGCVRTVSRVLEKAGAQEVRVSLKEGRAEFRAEGDARLFVEAVSRVGYRAELLEVREE